MVKNTGVNRDNRVSVIIPNYNGVKILPKCLKAMFKAKQNPQNNVLEIIVVDDCSTDDSVDLINRDFPEVRLIKHRVNRGFSSTVNTGVRSSKGILIALINSDVIVKSNFLVNTIDCFSDKSVFAVSLNEGKYGPSRGKFEGGYITHQGRRPTSKRIETFWVSGGSGVFRRDLWIKLGGLDEKLFSPFYWEDVDLSYRAHKRGYKLLWEPGSRVSHEHEGVIGKLPIKKRQRIQERNHLLFIWKNLTSNRLFRKHILGLFHRILRSPGYLRVVVMALFKTRLIAARRRKEKKEGRVSDESILAKFR